MSAACETLPNGPGVITRKMKNAAEAIATIPAASPSSPSTRFTALGIATAQMIVRITGRSPDSATTWICGPSQR